MRKQVGTVNILRASDPLVAGDDSVRRLVFKVVL